jgi:hypothetical protein
LTTPESITNSTFRELARTTSLAASKKESTSESQFFAFVVGMHGLGADFQQRAMYTLDGLVKYERCSSEEMSARRSLVVL